MGGPTTVNGPPAAGAQPAATNAEEPAQHGGAPSETPPPPPAALTTKRSGTPFPASAANASPQLASKPSGGDGGVAQAVALSPGVSIPLTPSGAPSTRTSLGLAMMDSLVDEAKLRHVSSKDQLEAAFRKREVAVTALKAKMSKASDGLIGGVVLCPFCRRCARVRWAASLRACPLLWCRPSLSRPPRGLRLHVACEKEVNAEG